MKKLLCVVILILVFGLLTRVTDSSKNKSAQTVTLAPIETDPISLLETKPITNPIAENRTATDSTVITYQQAWDHMGETRTVQGQLQHVFNSGKATILGFKDHHRGETKVRILQADYSLFQGNPELLYEVGDIIHVTGKIEWYQGDPVIYVSDPKQIIIQSD